MLRLSLLSLVPFTGALGGLHAQDIRGPTPGAAEIRTTGLATKAVVPNLVTLTIEFSVKRRTPGDAGRANAQRAVAIRRALVAVGIPNDSIITAGYRSQLDLGPFQRDTGFVATNTVVARIRDLRLVGPAIDTSLAEGATGIRDVRYSSSDTDESYLSALREATGDARRRAEAMANAAGGRLGRLIELTTDTRSSYDDFWFMRGTAYVEGGATTPIQAPVLQVNATVHGRWEFIPDR